MLMESNSGSFYYFFYDGQKIWGLRIDHLINRTRKDFNGFQNSYLNPTNTALYLTTEINFQFKRYSEAKKVNGSMQGLINHDIGLILVTRIDWSFKSN